LIHGGLVRWLHLDPKEVLDFSSNVNPFGPPKGAVKAAREALSYTHIYPDREQARLRRAFARWLGIDESAVCFGNGASDVMGAAIMAFRPGRIVTFSPTFGEYRQWGERLRVPTREIPLVAPNFAPSLGDLESTLSHGDLLVICQPNNPTGRVWTQEEMEQVLELCSRQGAILMVDECFVNLTWPPAPSAIEHLPRGNLLILRAFTKDFSAPGLRIGAALGHPDAVARIRHCLQPWPINCAGEAFATWCCENPEPFISDSRHRLAKERKYMMRNLRRLGFQPVEGDSNFILTRCPVPAWALAKELLKRRILIRTCRSFGLGDDHARLAVKDRRSNRALFNALEDALRALMDKDLEYGI
jgi:threonine-phosphate decarboxylase